MSPWPAELHAGQRLRRLTNTFLLWANRHSSWVTDEWACLCVCAPDSSVYVLRGVVEERNVFFFWGVAAFRRRMSAHMCVPEVQVRLCWTCWLYIGETQMWFLKCFFFFLQRLTNIWYRALFIARLSSDCVGVYPSGSAASAAVDEGEQGMLGEVWGSSKDEEEGNNSNSKMRESVEDGEIKRNGARSWGWGKGKLGGGELREEEQIGLRLNHTVSCCRGVSVDRNIWDYIFHLQFNKHDWLLLILNKHVCSCWLGWPFFQFIKTQCIVGS